MIRNFTHFLAGFAICIAAFHSTQGQKIYTPVGGLKDGGPATAAQLLTPSGLSIDADDNLYISEVGSYVIRKIDAATGDINIIAGNQVMWIDGDNGPALSASLASPVSVAVHPVTGDVYSADQLYNRVRRIDQTNGIIYRVAGDGFLSSFSGDGLDAIHGRLATPQGIAIAANGDIYIADASNQRIRKIDGTTGIISTVAGNGEAGFAGDGGLAIDAMLNTPTQVAVDEDNNFYIHDQGAYRIRRVDATTGNISTIAGDGTNGFTGDGGDAVDARISFVGGMIVRNGVMYFADEGNYRIRKIDFSTGDISTVVGNGDNAYGGDGGDPLLASISFSGSPVLDSNGDLIFADFGNNRIRKVSGGVITTVAGHGFFYGDGGPADKATIFDPTDVAFDEDGNMYITDQANFRIRKVDNASVITTIAGNGNNNLGGEGVDAATTTLGLLYAAEYYNGSLYFLENCRIRKLDLTTNQVVTVAGSGSCSYSGDNGQATSAELSPTDFSIGPDGIMFISDTHNYRIRRIDLTSGVITTIAGDGTQNDSGDGGQSVNAQISEPGGIDVDFAGENVYFADQNNNRIRKIELNSGVITTVAGTGVNGGTSVGGVATSTSLSNPSGVLVLANGNLLIVQGVTIFEVDKNDGVLSAFAGLGFAGNSGDGGPSVIASLTAPTRLTQSDNGDIYIADTGSERIRKIVLQASQTITFELSSPVTFGSGDIELVATATSGLPVYFESSDTNVAEIVNATTLRINGTGTIDITARQDGNADYAMASTVQTLTVDKANQTITFEYIDQLQAGVEPPPLEASATSSLPVSFSSSNPDVATVNGSTLTIVGPGTTTISASQEGDGNYLAAPDVTQELTIMKPEPEPMLLSPRGGVVGAQIPLQVKSLSDGVVSYTLTNAAGVATLSDGVLTLTGVGTADLEVNIAETAEYLAGSIQAVITVVKQRPVLEFTSSLSGKAGESLPLTLNANGSTGTVTYEITNVSGNASLSGSSLSLVGAGVVKVRATITEDGIYCGSSVEQFIRVFSGESTGSDARVFGITAEGGINNTGVIYSVKPNGDDYRVHHDFRAPEGTPQYGNMIVASNGLMYGLNYNGGLYGQGSIFEYDYVNNTQVVLFNFSQEDGAAPQGSLLEGSDGSLYGTTYRGGMNNFGTLFKYDVATMTYAKLFDFAEIDGVNSYSQLIEINGKIYGATFFTKFEAGNQPGGKMFEYDISTGITHSFYHFDPTTSGPGVGLAGGISKAPNGKYFGVTTGGTSSVFEFEPATNTITKRFQLNFIDGFAAFSNMVTAPNEKMYFLALFGGSSSGGSILEFNPDTYTVTNVHSFSSEGGTAPQGSLTLAPNGKLYGFTSKGGLNLGGVIFEFDPESLIYAVKIHLGGVNGSNPMGRMVANYDGKLYGLTQAGGSHDGGVLFSYDLNSASFEKKLDFKVSATGQGIQGNLAKDLAGENIYGAGVGGTANVGLIYRLDVDGGPYNVALDFALTGERFPRSLLQGSNGKIYGVTDAKSPDFGTFYEFNPTSGGLTAVVSLSETGTGYSAKLTEGPDGKIYGVAASGGANSNGTIFQFDSENGTIAVKHVFQFDQYGYPATRMLLASNGKFYGIVLSEGANNSAGFVYSFDPATDTYAEEKVLDESFSGQFSDLIDGPAQKIYGVIQQSATSVRIFEFDPLLGTVINKHNLPTTGGLVQGNLVYKDGLLIGSNRSGGDNGRGYIYTYNPDGDVFTIVKHFDGIDGATPRGFHLSTSTRTQEIAFDAIVPKVYLDAPFELRASSTSGFAPVFTSSDPTVATVEGTTVTIVGAGTATITASLPGSEFYGPASATQELEVSKAEQTITFDALESVTVVGAPFDLSATASSNFPVSYSVDDTSVATVSGSTITIVAAGSVTVTAHQEGDENFLAADDVAQVLVVNKLTQTISFAELPAMIYGDGEFDLTASATSDLAVVYVSSDDAVAVIEGNHVSIVGAGPVNITASQDGNEHYLPAESVIRTLEIAKAQQTITFGQLVTKTLGDAPFELTATVSSDLPVSFTSTSAGVTLAGNTVTLVSAGRAIVIASQAGDGNFLAATSIEQSFCVNPAKPTITAGSPGEEVTLTSSNSDGNQWYKEGQLIDGATASTYISDESGSYTVQTMIDDCISEISDSFVLIVTGVNARSESGMKIYPNPSSDFVIVQVNTVHREELALEIYDVVGRLVHSQKGSTNTTEQLDVSTYSPGMYRIVARSGSARYSGSMSKK
jgi:uncharacterized repeat protein (TIGR03803 family)